MRASDGDTATTVALLWRGRSGAAGDGRAGRRGPTPGLTVDAVVAAATELADAGGARGLETLTMRRLATRLGVAPMTLYTYVPAKAELADLVLDDAYRTMPRAPSAGQPWRRRVSTLAEENLALYRSHPWAARVDTARPVLGPGTVAKYEHELAAFDDTGLSDVDRDAALTFVLDFVSATARAESVPTTAAGEEAWWSTAGPALARVMDAEEFPRATRIGAAAGAAQRAARHPEHAWRFGLARVLDGLAALIDDAAR